MSGHMVEVDKSHTTYVCTTYNYQTHVTTGHLYKEDEKVEGHFIYVGPLAQ